MSTAACHSLTWWAGDIWGREIEDGAGGASLTSLQWAVPTALQPTLFYVLLPPACTYTDTYTHLHTYTHTHTHTHTHTLTHSHTHTLYHSHTHTHTLTLTLTHTCMRARTHMHTGTKYNVLPSSHIFVFTDLVSQFRYH